MTNIEKINAVETELIKTVILSHLAEGNSMEDAIKEATEDAMPLRSIGKMVVIWVGMEDVEWAARTKDSLQASSTHR